MNAFTVVLAMSLLLGNQSLRVSGIKIAIHIMNIEDIAVQ